MRIYSFSLTQLKPLHQGIQNQHSATELFVKYEDPAQPIEAYHMLKDWAKNHKTAIFLDGGFAASLVAVRDALKDSPYPWAAFYEDEATLFGIMTSVSVVLPPSVYEAAEYVRQGGVLMPSVTGRVYFNDHVVTPWDLTFIEVLNNYRMAS